MANLFHPCMRYIFVEKFADGMRRLKDAFGSAFASAVDSYLNAPKRVNRRGHGMSRTKIKTRVITNATIAKLREWLQEDYVIYDEALKRYEEQWNRPITSCNSFDLNAVK